MENGNERPKLVIIGAGIAGLSAAQYLQNHQAPCDVVILEANERVGGRIWTGEALLDFGAQFIHGRENNPIFKIAAERELISECESCSQEERPQSDGERNLFFTEKGKPVPVGVAREVCDKLDEILEEGNKFSREDISVCEDESIGTFIYREFYKYLRTCNDPKDVRAMKEGIFNWRLLQEKSDNACKSVFELSLYAWGEYLECPGTRYVEFKNGFSSIINAILEDIPKSAIYLNTPVKCILWDQCSFPEFDMNLGCNATDNNNEFCGPLFVKPKVMIQTSTDLVLSADYVLVTCPLGVLKRQAHDLFRPLLPSNKLAVINRMGFGTVDKVFLEFEEAFWDTDFDGIQFAWSADDRGLDLAEKGFHKEHLRKEWFRGIQGFDLVRSHPCMLEGWLAGEEAEVMETLPDAVVMEICHELLKSFTDRLDLPKPVRIMRSHWHSEPYILGSYSYIKLGHKATDCDLLAQPVLVKQEPRLMFAGEHTHKQYFSTTHGALLSGQREAQRLLDHLSQSLHPKDAVGAAGV